MVWFKIAVVAFATIPILNKYVFRVVNLEDQKVEIREGLVSIKEKMDDGEYEEARNGCNEFIAKFGDKKDEFSTTGTQTAMMWKGDTYRREWNYDNAAKAYKEIEDKYPTSPFAEHVLMMIATCNFDLAPTVRDKRDQKKKYLEAIEYYNKVVTNREKTKEFPPYKYTEITPGKYPISNTIYLEDMLLGIGRCYLMIREPEKAREMFDLVVTYFPGSERQDDALKFIGDSYLHQAYERSSQLGEKIGEKQQSDLQYEVDKYNRLALQNYQDFVNKYGQSDFKSDVLISMGEVYFRLDQGEKAIGSFNEAVNAIKVPEEQAKVQIKIGNYYYNSEQYEKAIETYAKVIKNFPDSKIAANAQYLTGESYERKGDIDEAFSSYEKVCDFYKTSPFYAPAAFKLGSKSMDKKDYNQALGYFRKGILLYPHSDVADQTQYMIGRCYQELKDFRKAVKEYEYVLGEYSGSKWVEEAHYQIGVCYNELNEKDKARDSFSKIEANRDLMMAGMSVIGYDLSNPDEQLRTWQDKLESEQDPEAQATAHIELGKIYLQARKEYTTAMEHFSQANELTQDEIKRLNVSMNIANTYYMMENFAQARELFLELMNHEKAQDEMKVQVEFKIHDSYRREKDFEKAREGLASFVSNHADHSLAPTAQFLLGLCYSDLKQYTQAVEEYKKVIQQWPEDNDMIDDAGLAIGNAYKEDGQLDLAIDYWENFMKEHPNCESAPQIYYQLGDGYRTHRNNCRKAINFYAQVYENYTTSFLYSPSAYQGGMCYLKLGDKETAQQVLELVRREDREFFKAAKAEIGKLLALVDYKKAITEYEEIENAAETDDDKAMARLGIGDIYQAKKMYKGAAESYRIVVDQYTTIPDDLRSGAYIKLTDSYNNLKQYKNVIKYANQMIEIFPENEFTVNAVYFKANAYYSLKNYKQAQAVFDQIIKGKKNPMLTEISSYQKAECLLFQKKPQAAIAAYAQFQKDYPKSSYIPLSIYQQGNAYWGLENYAKAKGKYLALVKKYPKFSEIDMAMAFLGFCYDKTDDWQTAKKYFQRVIKRNRKREAVKFAKEQLERINIIH